VVRIVTGLIALSVIAIAEPASAFCRTTTNERFVPSSAEPCDTTGKPLFWASKCVGYSVNRAASVQVDLATAQKLVADSFAEWAAHDCNEGGVACNGPGKPSITARDVGPVDCDAVEHTQGGTNANLIVFRDASWPHEGSALALTTVTFRLDSGEIYDVDMEIQSNPNSVVLAVRDPVASGQYDLRSILVHEIGHFLGLAHTERTNTDSTMFETYRPGQTFMRDIAPDDICGLCTAYPPSRTAACNDAPRGGLGNTCGGGKDDDGGCGCTVPGTPGADLTVPSLALAALLIARRRRSGTMQRTQPRR
jgi:hypothetical protein